MDIIELCKDCHDVSINNYIHGHIYHMCSFCIMPSHMIRRPLFMATQFLELEFGACSGKDGSRLGFAAEGCKACAQVSKLTDNHQEGYNNKNHKKTNSNKKQ